MGFHHREIIDQEMIQTDFLGGASTELRDYQCIMLNGRMNN